MDKTNKVRIIGNNKCFIESNAVQQLESVAQLENVVYAAGLPDLHYGKGPVGAAIHVKDKIYPHLIGNDIGCGMMLTKTNITKRKFKKDRIVKKLEKIDNLKDVENIDEYNSENKECPITNLGTIGGGNHFVEFQVLEKVIDSEEFEKLNFSRDDIMMLIHCGSRNYGEEVLREYINFDGFYTDSNEAKEYMEKHDNAILWAYRNRKEVADKLISYLGFSVQNQVIIDCCHNFIEKKDNIFIHRKGAVSSEKGAVVIPGSRGSFTYIVMPGDNTEFSGLSICHGAGRKWPWNLCKGRLERKYTKESIKETKMKSSVICHDVNLLYEESGEAYKNIDTIIKVLEEYNLIKVIAVMRPVITFKG